ncbi:MAG: hypothetical protein ACJ73D_00365 [Pyrinomonadaceae bacterium]
MRHSIITASLVLTVFVCVNFGQTTRPSRVVITSSMPTTQVIAAPRPSPTPIVVSTPLPTQKLPVTSPEVPSSQASNLNFKGLPFSQIKAKIAEAKRIMQTRPINTAYTEPAPGSPAIGDALTPVRIAYYDYKSKQIDFVVLSKDAFLQTVYPTTAISSSGHGMTIRTLRANGVNTPIVLTNDHGEAMLPLLVQYPVEKNGRFIETAYYMSTHPGIITPEVVNAGRFYVHNVIDIARDALRAKGYTIQPKVADIAEHLATVEHVDHMRFRTEFTPNIFNDIYTLYALNEGQTFRYSVSSAGAGGMVQMIPPTYRMVREHYPNAGLMPDFVEGMRNHVNATEAMLLYMQMTWNDLFASPTVTGAVASGQATEAQLMAAGYNSNPAKLAGYINRGGSGWTGLIPAMQ